MFENIQLNFLFMYMSLLHSLMSLLHSLMSLLHSLMSLLHSLMVLLNPLMSLQKYAQNMHIPSIMTSAKTGSKVEEAFATLVGEMQRSADPEHSRSIIVDLPSKQQGEKSGCNC